MTRKRHLPQQRRQHIQAWQQSGLSKNAGAQLHHINVKTFGNWTRQPRKQSAEKHDFSLFSVAMRAVINWSGGVCF